MLLFRKMKMDDLEFIYSDDELRSLLTVPPLGEKFGMLIEEDEIIKGGITGYTKGQGAMIQMIRVKDPKQNFQLIEGLLRALIYMLDIEDIKVVFSKSNDIASYKNVGFKEINGLSSGFNWKSNKIVLEDISDKPFIYLDVENFFNQPCCS